MYDHKAQPGMMAVSYAMGGSYEDGYNVVNMSMIDKDTIRLGDIKPSPSKKKKKDCTVLVRGLPFDLGA